MKKQHHHLMHPEKIFLYTGIGILFIALVYLVVDRDATSQLWIPFVMAVVALALTARFVR